MLEVKPTGQRGRNGLDF